jgi:predicted ABC-type transport system involved in lysophospholipase L1 biosynthesis ATPase subunit
MVLDSLVALNHREGATLVLVTHDPELTGHAKRTITMRDGRICG